MIPVFQVALQVPTETIRNCPRSQKDPNLSELSASEDIPFDALIINFDFRLRQRTIFLIFQNSKRNTAIKFIH